MTSPEPGSRPRIAVVGAGPAGTLTALHLARLATRRTTPIEIVLVDPAQHAGRGVAFGTADRQHLLNVPAAAMSAIPEEPGHFVSWRSRAENGGSSDPYGFAPRQDFGRYLDEVLTEQLREPLGTARLRRVRSRALGVRRREGHLELSLAEAGELAADAVVVAIGTPSYDIRWAPPELLDSPFFVADPWAPGALELIARDRTGPADVLLLGTGLTMVDAAITLSDRDHRGDRRLHAVSRGGRLPRTHAGAAQLAAIPDVSDWGNSLAEIRERALAHLHEVRESTGDWRPGMDGLRLRAGELWGRLSEADRSRFLAQDARRWNVLRHRMPPNSAALIDALRATGRLSVDRGEVLHAEPLSRGGLAVRLGGPEVPRRTIEVGWVVNCTGSGASAPADADPFVRDLLRPRAGGPIAMPATEGLGLRTVQGRLLAADGSTDLPLWTLGSLRRGELWESTAIPEIRSQAQLLATAVLDQVAPLPRRLADGRVVGGHHPVARPRDPLGLPLSTTSEAAALFNSGLERVLRLQSGGEALIREATEVDPGFAVGHAALAMLGHEAGAAVDVAQSLTAARAATATADERERSFVEVVTRRVEDVRDRGAAALMRHLALHPRDVLAVSAAVPTIAFSGVTDVQQEAWDLVEGLAPAYGDHWWYISLLAFTRQDQGRFEEAGLLAEAALACEPASGHAVHAQTHVMYETGQHTAGRAWLDHWVAQSGRSASHRAHFSWHAALHELALGDTEAMRQRYYSQLAPPAVTGVRSLVDSASLLWRWKVALADWDTAVGPQAPTTFEGEAAPPPVQPVIEALDAALLDQPETPFVSLHSALALAAAGDDARLAALQQHCARSADPAIASVVAPVCEALLAANDQRWGEAAGTLDGVLPRLVRVGGSAAQREVVEETLLFCLVHQGEADRALDLLDSRLDRRTSPLDAARRRSLRPVPVA